MRQTLAFSRGREEREAIREANRAFERGADRHSATVFALVTVFVILLAYAVR